MALTGNEQVVPAYVKMPNGTIYRLAGYAPAPTGGGGGGAPSGPAGGDLSGTYPNPQIATGAIVDADISASAAIAQSKVATLSTDLSNRVLKAGDTMTGSLTMAEDPAKPLQFGAAGGGILAGYSGDHTVKLSSNGPVYLKSNSSNVRVDANSTIDLNATTINCSAILDFGVNGKVVNLGTPSSSTDAATKGYADTNFVGKSGIQSMAGPLTITGAMGAGGQVNAGNAVVITAAAGTSKSVYFATSGTNAYRWAVVSNSTTETGSSVGSDFNINRYNDTGTLIDTPVSITRSTGNVTFNSVSIATGSIGTSLTVPNSPASGQSAVNKQYVDAADATKVALAGDVMTGTLTAPQFSINKNAGNDRSLYIYSNWSPRWTIGANPTAESGSNAGTDFILGRYTDAGAFIDSPVIIYRSTGIVSTLRGLDVNSNVISNVGTPSATTDGANKAYVDARTPKVTVATTAPSSPAVNDIWIDAS